MAGLVRRSPLKGLRRVRTIYDLFRELYKCNPAQSQPLQWASPYEPGHLLPGGVRASQRLSIASTVPQASADYPSLDCGVTGVAELSPHATALYGQLRHASSSGTPGQRVW